MKRFKAQMEVVSLRWAIIEAADRNEAKQKLLNGQIVDKGETTPSAVDGVFFLDECDEKGNYKCS